MPVISRWANGWHGLDALGDPWNVVLGLAVFFLARVLGALYFVNSIADEELVGRCRCSLWANASLFWRSSWAFWCARYWPTAMRSILRQDLCAWSLISI